MVLSRFVCLCAIALMFYGCASNPEEKRDHFMSLGDKYFDRGDHSEATIFYRKALQYDRRFADAYYKLGLASIELKKGQQALEALRRAFELDRDNLDAFRKLGELYLTAAANPSPNYNKAAVDALVALTELAEENHPTAKEVLFMKGRILVAQERPEDGLDYLEQASGLDPGDAGIALSLAAVQYQSGQKEAAEQTARAVLAGDPAASAFYDFLYRFYAADGRLDEAQDVLEARTEALPDEARHWVSLAGFYTTRGKKDEAGKALKVLLDNPEKFPNPWLTIGDFHVVMGDSEAAVKAYEDGIKAQPEQKDVFVYRRIYAYLSRGDRATASQAIDAILAENDDDYQAIGLRGVLHLHSGDSSQLDLALKDLQAATSEFPDDVALQYQYGRALLMSGDTLAAENKLRDAIQKDPGFLPVRYTLLDLHLSKGEYSEAEVVAERVLTDTPLDASARLALAIARMGLRRYDDARQNLMLLLEYKQRMRDATWQLGRLDLIEGKLGHAEQRFRALSALDPPDPRGTRGLLEVYLAQNRLGDARTIVDGALATEPENTPLRILSARLALAANETGRAKGELSRVVEAEPENGPAHRYLAEIAITEGDQATASSHLQTALDAQPPIPEVFYRYGTLLFSQGDSQGAVKHLQRCVELAPDHADALNNLAYILADLEMDLSMAVTYAQRAVAREPEIYDYSDTLGFVYIKRRLYQNAIDVLGNAVKGDPTRGDFRYHLGLALFHAGEKERAAVELRTAKSLQLSTQDASGVESLLNQIGD